MEYAILYTHTQYRPKKPVNPSKSTYQDFETCDSYGVGVFNVAQVLVQLASTLAAADAGDSDFYRRVLEAVTAPKTEGPKLGMSEESTEEPVVGCGAWKKHEIRGGNVGM